ncbi:hypothetical protein C8R43DRAFT_1170245 [Mycena crocata]|nr:hypothetical protein C8R43DRAFT_1170245 [Mycena crocata]
MSADPNGIVKDQVSQFIENSKILVNVLDEVAKVHPFIQMAVSIFKAGIQLELTRRENDARVVFLYTTMCDTMEVLTLLKKVPSPKEVGPDGKSIEDRLRQRMGSIIDSIKYCAKICDTYQHQHTAKKYITSLKWEGKFEDAAQQFADHKNAIQADLQIQISVGISDANATLAIINQNVSVMMKMVFERMVPPEERDIARFFKNNGGKDAIFKDEKLLKQLMDKSERESKSKGDLGQTSNSRKSAASVSDFKRELSKDIDEILAENNKIFEQKFGAIELSLRDVKITIQREGDRVVGEILANLNTDPHIIDRGWKGSVKANHLVMAIHDYFARKTGTILKRIHDIATDHESDAQKVEHILGISEATTPPEDMWALDHIIIQRIQPLIEALDDDGSSFVTVQELNEFTTSRPADWSLPRWIAYWTTGFEMSVQWYYRRIRRRLAALADASKKVLPANRLEVSRFMGGVGIEWTQSILAGLCNVEDFDWIDWDNDPTFLKFKGWLLDNEKRMKTVLRRLSYQIDQYNTLVTVTGQIGRPEQYILPVVYLVLERASWITDKAHEVVLDPRELNSIDASFGVVFDAAYQRADRLQSIYRFQNVEMTGKLKKVFFGLWTYALDDIETGPNWSRDLHRDDHMPDEDTDDLEVAEPPLFFNELRENLDQPTEKPLEIGMNATSVDNTSSADSMTGEWSGTYAYRANPAGVFIGLAVTFCDPDGSFTGSGSDANGAYFVHGKVEGRSVRFLKSYARPRVIEMAFWGNREQGDLEKISGLWGTPEILDMEPPRLKGEGETQGDETDRGKKTVEEDSSRDAAQRTDVPAVELQEVAAQLEVEQEKEEGPAAHNASGDGSVSGAATNFVGFIGGFFTLCRQPAANGEILKAEADSTEWDQLMAFLRSNEFQLWRAMAAAKRRREVEWRVTCDNCPKWPIGTTRLCCIECSKDEVLDTLDLSADCFHASVDRKKDSKHHVPSHKLLQLRRGVIHWEGNGLEAVATSVVEAVDNPDSCHYCATKIEDKRYLICLDCKEGHTFVCLTCNTRHEETKPWCVQQTAPMENEHDYMHDMVLVGAPEEKTGGEESKVDERFASFQAKVLAQVAELREESNARLGRVEGLLEQLLSSISQQKSTKAGQD